MKDFSFGHLLVVTRLKQGMQQKDFAKVLGITQSTLCKYERNQAIPNLKFFEKIVQEYGFPVLLYIYKDIDIAMSFQLTETKTWEFILFENKYNYKPRRLKSKRKRNQDLMQIVLKNNVIGGKYVSKTKSK